MNFDLYDEVPNQRSADFADLEMKAMSDGFVFDGYAAVFGEPTDLGEFTEEIRHGAFRKVLGSGANVPLLHEHNPEQFLASTKSGRLRLFEEPRGLRVSANIVRTDLSERIKALVDGGEVRGMSFGFICGKGNSDFSRRNGKPHRIVKNFQRLLDVCTTWDPAYASAEAQFRSLMATTKAAEMRPAQQLLTGVYPQLEEQGDDDIEEARNTDPPSGVGDDAPLLAARKRRLQLLTITLEGEDL